MIAERAQELGRLIGQSDEYKALRRANEQIKDAADVREKMERLQALAVELEELAAGGGEPPAERVSEYNALLSEIQGRSDYQAVVAAQANFDKLMLRVNEQILEGIKKGAASPIITLG